MQKPLERLEGNQEHRTVKDSSKTRKTQTINQKEKKQNHKITKRPKQKKTQNTKTKQTLFRKLKN